MKINRLFVRILTPLLALSFAVAPSQSYAFVPAAVGGYGLPTLPTSGSYAAASGSAPIAVGAAAFAIGMAIGYYGLEYMLGDGTPQHVRIPLTTDPAKAVPPPPAVSSVAATVGYSATIGTYTRTGSTPDSACQNALGSYLAGTGATGVSYKGAVGGYCQVTFSSGSSNDYYGSYAASTTCPTGYSVSGSNCVLADARAATPDNQCDFARSGTNLTAITDPDCQAALLKMPLLCNNGVCTGQGLDTHGNPENYSITPRADGGSTVTTATQQTVNGQTQVQTTTAGVSSAGVVDGVSGSVSAGYIPVSQDGSATTPVTTNAPLQSPSTSTPTTFPTDYARTGEAAAAAQPIANAIQAQTAADQAWRDGEQARKDAEKGTIPPADLIPKQTVNISYSPVSFASSASCPAPVGFNVFGHDYSVSYDPLCNVMSFMRPIFLAAGAMAAAAIFIGGLKT